MQLHADFSKQAVVHAAKLDWLPSPMKGVERRMLDRVGGEMAARATTIVRYAPGSAFSSHIHGGGEEFIVLEGVFQDEHGDYPAGSYIRNPPTSSHTPRSDGGCIIFVKLGQFHPQDRTTSIIDSFKMEKLEDPAKPGVSVTPLFNDNRETVRIEYWAAGETVPVGAAGGAEYLLLEGGFTFGGENFERYSWLRLPTGEKGNVVAGPEGAKIWVKTDHLGVSGE